MPIGGAQQTDRTAKQVVQFTYEDPSTARIVKRAFVTGTVQKGDVGHLVPHYDTNYSSVAVYRFTSDGTDLALGDLREIGVVDFGPRDTGEANSFVDVVIQGETKAYVRTGTAHPVNAGEFLEFSTNAAGSFIKTTLGQTSKYCVGVALEAAATGTVATAKTLAAVFLVRPLKTVNTTSTAGW